MGGRWIDPLSDLCTHLVTQSVRTKKYEVNTHFTLLTAFFPAIYINILIVWE